MHWKSHIIRGILKPSFNIRRVILNSILSAAMTDQPSTIPYHESKSTTLSITKYSQESPEIMASMSP
jgi:hypothetical protein